MYRSIRTTIAILTALMMATPIFIGVVDISYAAGVVGAKATNYGFRMVRISWKAVKVELPQEPATPAELQEQSVSAESEEAERPMDSAANLNGEAAAVSVESYFDSAGDQTEEPEDPNTYPDNSVTEPKESAENNADVAADSSGELTVESSSDPSGEPSGDSPIDPSGNPTLDTPADVGADAAEEPVVEPLEQTAPESVYDVITYKIYRAAAKNDKFTLIKTTKETSLIDKDLSVGKKYYYKIIAYRSNGEKYGNPVTTSIRVAAKVTVNMTLLMKNGAAFNYRIAAKQKLYQYDTLQGACANGGFAYLTLYNRKVEKCKIVKVKLSNLSIVKVSAALPIFHGNNLTYNTKKKQIVATYCTTVERAKYRVALINPQTLKVISTKNARLTKDVKKLPKKVRMKNIGYSAIAYNEKHNCYVARLRNDGNVVILNKDLKPLRYVVLKGKKTALLEQGIETVDDYIYDVRSFKGEYNYSMVTVHTMNGRNVGQMMFPNETTPKKELECIFHDGKQFYAGFYYTSVQMNSAKKAYVNRVNWIQRLNNL